MVKRRGRVNLQRPVALHSIHRLDEIVRKIENVGIRRARRPGTLAVRRSMRMAGGGADDRPVKAGLLA